MSHLRPLTRGGVPLTPKQVKWVDRLRTKLTKARVPADRIDRLGWKGFELRHEQIKFREDGKDGKRWVRKQLAPVAAAVTGQQIADPTQTSNLRNAFAAKLRARVRRTIRLIIRLLSKQDIIVGQAMEGIIFAEELRAQIISIIQTNLMGDIEDLLEDETRVIIQRAARSATRRFARETGIRDKDAFESLTLAFDQPVSPQVQSNMVLAQIGLMTKFTNAFQSRVLSTLSDGIQAGESISQLRDRVMEATNFAASRAESIARTETIRTFNQAAVSRFQQHGVNMVEWITAGDERVDPDICEPLEGERFLIGTEPENPAHTRCRCSWLPVILGGPSG